MKQAIVHFNYEVPYYQLLNYIKEKEKLNDNEMPENDRYIKADFSIDEERKVLKIKWNKDITNDYNDINKTKIKSNDGPF